MTPSQPRRGFPTESQCLDHLESLRWNGRPICPYCCSAHSTPLQKERRHHCNHCNTSYSVTVGTLFHRTRIALPKWFLAIALILSSHPGRSARQLAQDLQVNKDTAWRMAGKIKSALARQGVLLRGIAEVSGSLIDG